MKQLHNITKIITKSSLFRFLVETKNKSISFPTLKSLKIGFPNVKKSEIKNNNKNNGQVLDTPKQTREYQTPITGNDIQ